eukprot:8172212-Alexandrium_andersonii.AAC.1
MSDLRRDLVADLRDRSGPTWPGRVQSPDPGLFGRSRCSDGLSAAKHGAGSAVGHEGAMWCLSLIHI